MIGIAINVPDHSFLALRKAFVFIFHINHKVIYNVLKTIYQTSTSLQRGQSEISSLHKVNTGIAKMCPSDTDKITIDFTTDTSCKQQCQNI